MGNLRPTSADRRSNHRLPGNNAQGAVNLAGITANVTLHSSTVVAITFSQPLPDVARYRVRLDGVTDSSGNAISGDNSCVMTALKGDVDGNFRVDMTDVGLLNAQYTRQVNLASVAAVRADYNMDGGINATDIAGMAGCVNHDATSLLAPLLPVTSGATASVIDSADDRWRCQLSRAESQWNERPRLGDVSTSLTDAVPDRGPSAAGWPPYSRSQRGIGIRGNWLPWLAEKIAR